MWLYCGLVLTVKFGFSVVRDTIFQLRRQLDAASSGMSKLAYENKHLDGEIRDEKLKRQTTASRAQDLEAKLAQARGLNTEYSRQTQDVQRRLADEQVRSKSMELERQGMVKNWNELLVNTVASTGIGRSNSK